MEAVLKVNGVSGGYSLNKPVLHGITLDVKPGEMVGLIGLNGAGKSTAIKHILGLMRPHEGTIMVNGADLQRDAPRYKSNFAYVPEAPSLYEEMTVLEHLKFSAMVYGLEQKQFEQRSRRLLEQFQMGEQQHVFSRHLSKGMKQKVMIMCAFLVQPALYLIDEPFLGLDPLGIRTLLEQMVAMKREGASILLSSHILSMIESYCDRFILLHKGRILAAGTLQDIRQQAEMPDATLEQLFFKLVGGSES